MTIADPTMSPEELLSIPMDRPARLLPFAEKMARKTWRQLAAEWHPDRNPNPQAKQVLQHLIALDEAAQRQRRQGVWIEESALTFVRRGGTPSIVPCMARTETKTELGRRVIGSGSFVEIYNEATCDLMAAASSQMSGLRFADEAMRCEMRSWLPDAQDMFETTGGLGVLVLNKQPDQVLLSDLLTAAQGALDARHVAWILNGMLHVACYLEWAGISHNAIGPETWLISPAHHLGTLIGGWCYAAFVGDTLTALPSRSVAAAPSALMRNKTATTALDRELIKLTGRELLGDPSGMGFAGDVPSPIAMWLRQPPGASAITDYRDWQDALRRSFGRPRFVEMTLDARDIYPNLDEKE